MWTPCVGSWYRECGIEYDGCGETEYREGNIDDKDRIFLLENRFRVP